MTDAGSAFPPREMAYELQKVTSRGGKPFSNFKKPFPVAGNRFSTSKSHFPRREERMEIGWLPAAGRNAFSLWLWVNIFSD
jgi:hypothetical protein